MILALATLAAYLRTCAPTVSADTMRAIVAVESRGYSYAINDNTVRIVYCVPGARVYPCTRNQAAAIANTAVARGHSVDIGLAQVNSVNFQRYGVSAGEMLNPCANLRIGSEILASAYLSSTTQFPDRRQALWHAIMAYNTGSLYDGATYVQTVVAAAMVAERMPTVPSLALLENRQPAAQRRTGAPASDRRANPQDPRSAPLQASDLGPTHSVGLRETMQPALTR